MIRHPEMKKRATGAAALVLLLSGCMLGPDYRRPAVTTPDAFRGASAVIPPDKQSIAELKWFEVFQDEQLQELIRTALTQNYDLRDAVARVDAARANLGITQADQYPNFGIGADVNAIEASRRGQFTIPRGTSRERTFSTVFLDLFTFEIDIWGRLRRATEASRADLLGADWNRKAVVTTLISDVATAYFSLLELDLELEIAKNTLATRAESLRLIRLQDCQMRAFGGDLIVVPFAARFGHRRYLGDIDDGPGAILRLWALVVDICLVRALGADGFGIGNAKKDAAVRGVVGPELSPDLEVLVRILRDQMATLAFVGHDRAVLGPPVGVADPVPVVQGLGVRAVKKHDPSRVTLTRHLW
jgi:hypothetical protein